jgi:hypothetical protein
MCADRAPTAGLSEFETRRTRCLDSSTYARFCCTRELRDQFGKRSCCLWGRVQLAVPFDR